MLPRSAWTAVVLAATCTTACDSATNSGSGGGVNAGGSGAAGTGGEGGEGGGALVAGTLYVTDEATNSITAIDTDGNLVDSFASPVPDVRGIAVDRIGGDGLWVVGDGDGNTFVKMDFEGTTLDTVFVPLQPCASGPRGLDTGVNPDSGDDVLAVICHNGDVQGIYGSAVSAGEHQFQGSFHDGTMFLDGFWGVHYVGGASPFARWATRMGNIEPWDDIGQGAEPIVTTLVELRGLQRDSTGNFWVVDAADGSINAVAPSGEILRTITTGLAAASGLTLVE
jgi:hypothetical protein